jgi:hypothetical protein
MYRRSLQQSRNLKQLADAWQYLTPFQRKRLVFIAKLNLFLRRSGLYLLRLPSSPPRISILLPYLLILYTVTGTIIMIATVHPEISIVLFAGWVVLLYAVTRYITVKRHKNNVNQMNEGDNNARLYRSDPR